MYTLRNSQYFSEPHNLSGGNMKAGSDLSNYVTKFNLKGAKSIDELK